MGDLRQQFVCVFFFFEGLLKSGGMFTKAKGFGPVTRAAIRCDLIVLNFLSGGNNAGIVIPAGVAHAIRAEGSEDVIMVYGTSTAFRPEFEGRISSEIETAVLPESWQRFLDRS